MAPVQRIYSVMVPAVRHRKFTPANPCKFQRDRVNVTETPYI